LAAQRGSFSDYEMRLIVAALKITTIWSASATLP